MTITNIIHQNLLLYKNEEHKLKVELVSLKIGERSAFYALKYGVELTEEEYQAIINYDKSDDDKQSKWYGCTLSTILKQANELAIIEEKNNQNGG